MPVGGPTGPGNTASTSGAGQQPTTVETPKQTLGSGVVGQNLPDLGSAAPPGPGGSGDAFEGSKLPTGGPNPIAQQQQVATDRFATRMNDILNTDALSLAQGQKPWRNGDPLSADQQKQLQNAAKDYVMDLPIGSFAPEVAKGLADKLRAAGHDVGDLSGKSLKDIGKVAGDIAGDTAKGLANQLKENSPAGYYGLLAGGAAAIGYYGYSQGSDALKKLGVKPQIKQGFFNKSVELRAEATWESKFKNFDLVAGLRTNHTLGDLTLRTDTRYGLHKGYLGTSVDGHLRLSDRSSLSAGLTYLPAGVTSLGTVRDNDLGLSTPGPSDHDRLLGSVNYRYQANRNLDLAVSGSFDTQGESRIGVGLSWRF